MDEDFKRKLSEMEDLDEKIIANKPWAQHLLSTSLNITRKAVLNWCNIVSKIGEAELQVDEYVSIFIAHLENLYEEMIADVDTIQEKSLDRIMKLLQQMQNLCRDLRAEIPQFNYEEVPLCELYKIVLQRVKEYEALVEIRRRELRDLHSKQITVCKSLGREPRLLPESPLPLPTEIEDLKGHIELLENEALEREEKFFRLKEEISQIVGELGIGPRLDFEKDVLNLTNREVMITDGDMEQLQLYRDRVGRQLENVKEEIEELRGKVDDLWEKLEIDIGERDEFRNRNAGNSVKTLSGLKAEVRRLEEMKKANIQGFIYKQRQELQELWDKCHCTEREKSEFSFFNSECYNEDLFELHDREIEKWKRFYEENRELFCLLNEYKGLWSEHLDLELNSGRANRYKNRGGQLLIEEKLRNKFKKKIPKIEDTLIKLAETYYQLQGKHFTTFGLTVEEFIKTLHEDADKEFKLKLSAKKQQRDQISSVGRSRMNLFPPSTSSLNPTLTPRQTSKRKVLTAPVTEPVKKLKTVSQSKPRSGMPKVNINRRRSARREKLRQRLSFTKSSGENSNMENTVSTSYRDFEKEVTLKNNNCRSTGFVLKEHNIKIGLIPPTPPSTKKDDFLMPAGVSHLQKTPMRRPHK